MDDYDSVIHKPLAIVSEYRPPEAALVTVEGSLVRVGSLYVNNPPKQLKLASAVAHRGWSYPRTLTWKPGARGAI